MEELSPKPELLCVQSLFRFTFKRVIANNQPQLMVPQGASTTTGGSRCRQSAATNNYLPEIYFKILKPY